MRGRRGLIVLFAFVLVGGACTSDDEGGDGDGAVADDRYEATITRTTDGVAHVVADDEGSLSFGQGWASAEDHGCDLMDQIVKVRGERAKWFGPGEDDANITSDFAWKAIDPMGLAATEWPDREGQARALIEGFAAGWNAALDDLGGFSGWCDGAEWVRPITAEELYAYMRSITVLASSGAVATLLGTAPQPPGAADAPTTTAAPASFGMPDPTELASNGWAIGSERSTDETGMLVANPHFPWEGVLRFWEVHLTIPGELDVYGAQLAGVPGVGVGFTRHVAWTHTVSAGRRFTAYRLTLAPGDPTSYLYDGEPRKMTSEEATIEVKGADGAVTPLTRTMWSSHYGPILDFPGVGWTETEAITFRDANIDNDEFIEQYLAMNQADSLEEFQQAHEEHQGVPLFNTIAVDDEGRAWYADTSATPNLSPEAIDAWLAARESDPIVKLANESQAVLLDGSDSMNEWVEVDGARDPGLVPYSEMPQIERDDYAFNANDSFWLPHATEWIEGDYSPLHGEQKTSRSWRTRENAWVLDDTTAEGPSGDDGTFTLDELAAAALRNEAGTARALRQTVVDACRATPNVTVDGQQVDLTEACDILDAWDGRYDVDSVGAVVWREFWSSDVPADYATPFDAAKPVDTPTGYADPAAVVQKLGRGVRILTDAGVALDTPLGELQQDGRFEAGSTRTGLGGGYGGEGITNALGWSAGNTTVEETPTRPEVVSPKSTLTPSGYWINNGTSFLMAVEFTEDGPVAKSILTYGQTEDRSSPLFTVQTERFAAKDWKDVAYTDAQVKDQAVGEPRTVTGER